MKNENAIFTIQSNRDLFSTERVVGKKLKIVEYKRFFKNKELIKILENEALCETAKAFLCGNLNLAQASTNSYMHRNTLIYRIEKINSTIGLDLKKFEDCVLFVNMLEIYKMVVNKKWCLKTHAN